MGINEYLNDNQEWKKLKQDLIYNITGESQDSSLVDILNLMKRIVDEKLNQDSHKSESQSYKAKEAAAEYFGETLRECGFKNLERYGFYLNQALNFETGKKLIEYYRESLEIEQNYKLAMANINKEGGINNLISISLKNKIVPTRDESKLIYNSLRKFCIKIAKEEIDPQQKVIKFQQQTGFDLTDKNQEELTSIFTLCDEIGSVNILAKIELFLNNLLSQWFGTTLGFTVSTYEIEMRQKVKRLGDNMSESNNELDNETPLIRNKGKKHGREIL